jgi:hypothetical protein
MALLTIRGHEFVILKQELRSSARLLCQLLAHCLTHRLFQNCGLRQQALIEADYLLVQPVLPLSVLQRNFLHVTVISFTNQILTLLRLSQVKVWLFSDKKPHSKPRSALDRINVRRLLIYVKKEISRISNGLLFDPNTEITWERFKGQAIPFLDSVKARLGLEDYKVVLDSTTTTPDLIDRNVMYAKIFLKPTRAIEFIAVDFVITNTGAAFED